MQAGSHAEGRVGIDGTEMDTSRENSRKPVAAARQEKNRLKGIPLVEAQMNLGLAIKIQTNIVINGHRTCGPRAASHRTIGPRTGDVRTGDIHTGDIPIIGPSPDSRANGIGNALAVIGKLNSKERHATYRQHAFEHRHTNMMSHRGHTTKIIHQIQEF
jgi:hypothetical protein